MLRPRTPLFNVATEASNGGGGAPTTPPAAPAVETTPTVSAETPGAEPPKPGVIAQATALLRGANGNAATIAAIRADLTARDATIEQLRSDLATRDTTIGTLTTELQAFRSQAADLQTVVQTLESQRNDVQTEVIHQLAAAGLPESQLPKSATQVQHEDTIEVMREKLTDTSLTSAERGQLAQKIRSIRDKN